MAGLILGIFIMWLIWLVFGSRLNTAIWIMGLLAISVLLIIVAVASAAENPAPASAENAVTVKGYTACPTEFNPDDSAWAMHNIKYELKKFQEDIMVVEHRRIFSYFPDAEQRIFVGIKKWGNPDCIAELFSYGSTSGIDQKRVWGAIHSKSGTTTATTVFLLTDKGWEKGGSSMPETSLVCGAEQCNIVFALYRDNVQVVSRALPVAPTRHFFNWHPEPVE